MSPSHTEAPIETVEFLIVPFVVVATMYVWGYALQEQCIEYDGLEQGNIAVHTHSKICSANS